MVLANVIAYSLVDTWYDIQKSPMQVDCGKEDGETLISNGQKFGLGIPAAE